MYIKCSPDEISLNNVSLILPLCIVSNGAPTFVQWVSTVYSKCFEVHCPE